MAINTFGNLFTITTFGESHGPGIGVIVDGVPAGIRISNEDIQVELDRRRPGQNLVSTKRSEDDKAEILSGIFENKTTGAPIGIVIRNKDAESSKYRKILGSYRPGHADYTYDQKYGHRDWRGGGRSSGRETACRVAAGAIAKQYLAGKKIRIVAASTKIGGVEAKAWDEKAIETNPVRCPDPEAAQQMEDAIVEARKVGDSVGGIIECRVTGVPPGLGEPIYDKLDAMLAHAMFSIGAVRALEFGNGFACADLLGSENNDPMVPPEDFGSNRCGGILGGISNGEEIVFRLAVKPTASISKKQQTVDKEGRPQEIRVEGRHDPCICPRAVPVVEAMTAITLMDALLMNRIQLDAQIR